VWAGLQTVVQLFSEKQQVPLFFLIYNSEVENKDLACQPPPPDGHFFLGGMDEVNRSMCLGRSLVDTLTGAITW